VRALERGEEHSLAWKSSRNPMAPEMGCRGLDLPKALPNTTRKSMRCEGERPEVGGRGRALAGRRDPEIPFSR